jgi:hypothetical protein
VFAEALRGGLRGGGFGPPAPAAAAPPPVPALDVEGKSAQFQILIDRYRNEGGGRTVAGSLPVDVIFPMLGPSLFLASELTAESQAPSIDLTIRRIK